MKITPENITELLENEVFVFGSNESGRHGGGAARLAHQKFGAVMGVGFGHQGQTFAIPTLDWHLSNLALSEIKHYIIRFIDYAMYNPNHTFYVTKIGCGIAGYQLEDIADLFAGLTIPSNVALPQEFINRLNEKCGVCGRSIHNKGCNCDYWM